MNPLLRLSSTLLFFPLGMGTNGCAPTSTRHTPTEYESTVAGAALGTAWGAGTGAIIGHQLSYAGEGAAVGAALGLVAGTMSGNGIDRVSSQIRRQEEELAHIKAHNVLAFSELQEIQTKLDTPPLSLKGPYLTTVFFDSDATTLRAGSLSELEVIAEFIKANPYTRSVVVMGHSDDGGNTEYALRVSEARARSVVSALSSKGVAADILKVESYGSTRPLASNTTSEGRQLNRRVEVVVK
jgi:outer membrane protein OmpA-like peptidoglycan-associated protein